MYDWLVFLLVKILLDGPVAVGVWLIINRILAVSPTLYESITNKRKKEKKHKRSHQLVIFPAHEFYTHFYAKINSLQFLVHILHNFSGNFSHIWNVSLQIFQIFFSFVLNWLDLQFSISSLFTIFRSFLQWFVIIFCFRFRFRFYLLCLLSMCFFYLNCLL